MTELRTIAMVRDRGGEVTYRARPQPGWAKRLARRLVCAQVVVILLFGPYLANLSTGAELHLRYWRTGDALFLLSALAGFGMVCLLVGELFGPTRRDFLRRLFEHVFVVAVGAGVFANIAFYVPAISKHGMPMETAWLALIGLVTYSLATPGSKLVLRAKQLCLILSPILVIVPIHLLRADTYPSESDPLVQTLSDRDPEKPRPDRKGADRSDVIPVRWGNDPPVRESLLAPRPRPSGAVPVYMFVFDMWSYERTFDGGRIRAVFPNLKALSKRSIIFHEAHSPGASTIQSMPRLLFDTDLEATYGQGRVGFRRDGKFVSPSELTSLFSTARGRGYHSYFVGFSLPYKLWLGSEVETCRTYRWCQRHPGDGPLERAGMHLVRAMSYWTDPWATTFHSRFHLALDGVWAIRIHESITADVLYCIRNLPPNTLGFFHHPLPHYPYILNEAGGYRKPLEVGWDYEDPEEYHRALVGMDKAVGEFVSAMKEAGRFDDALLILTSDHGWTFDPNRKPPSGARKTGETGTPLTHVPLMVKLPGQRRSISVETRFETRSLRMLIDRVVGGMTVPGEIDGLLAVGEEFGTSKSE